MIAICAYSCEAAAAGCAMHETSAKDRWDSVNICDNIRVCL